MEIAIQPIRETPADKHRPSTRRMAPIVMSLLYIYREALIRERERERERQRQFFIFFILFHLFFCSRLPASSAHVYFCRLSIGFVNHIKSRVRVQVMSYDRCNVM